MFSSGSETVILPEFSQTETYSSDTGGCTCACVQGLGSHRSLHMTELRGKRCISESQSEISGSFMLHQKESAVSSTAALRLQPVCVNLAFVPG